MNAIYNISPVFISDIGVYQGDFVPFVDKGYVSYVLDLIWILQVDRSILEVHHYHFLLEMEQCPKCRHLHFQHFPYTLVIDQYDA